MAIRATFGHPALASVSPLARPFRFERIPATAAERQAEFVVFARIREYIRRRHVIYQLSRLGDRELADIGMTRCDIGQIYDPRFAERRAAERS